MRAFRPRSPYRTRLFWWADADSIACAFLLVLFAYFCMVGLPIALPEGLAGSVRGQLVDIGFTIEGRR